MKRIKLGACRLATFKNSNLPIRVSVWEGELWVTQEGDINDYVLGPGESALFCAPGLLICEARQDSEFYKDTGPEGSSSRSEHPYFSRLLTVRTWIYLLLRSFRGDRPATRRFTAVKG
jgi:hypothetical protein